MWTIPNWSPTYGLIVPYQRWAQVPQSQGGALRLAHRTGQTGLLKICATCSRQQVAIRQPDPEAAYA